MVKLRTPFLVFVCAIGLSAQVRAEKVAITFDDLPLNGALPAGVDEAQIARRVLAILEKRHAPPVYGFVNGKKLLDNQAGREAMRLWVAAGEPIGSHTYSHLDLHRSSSAEFIADIEANEASLRALGSGNRSRWLRYPYLREGDTVEKRRVVREYLRENHYRIAQVTLDYEDYLWNTPAARCQEKRDEQALQYLRDSYLRIASEYIDHDRQLAKLTVGRAIDHVLLLHLGAFSEEILPPLLDLLAQKGLTLATLEQVERDPVYKIDPDAGSKYGGTLLEQLMDARKIPYPPVTKKPTAELNALCK